MTAKYFGHTIRFGISALVVLVALTSVVSNKAFAAGYTPQSSTAIAATNPMITQELHVTAKVLPMRRVIVDNQGQILRITSNTTESISPTVFRGSDTPENQIALSPEIANAYKSLVPSNAGIGTLYERSIATSFQQSAARISVVLQLPQPLQSKI